MTMLVCLSYAGYLLRKLLKRQMRPPRVMITDKLKSYGAAKWEIMPGIEHRQQKGLNNRAEKSHQPTRRQERQMKRFKSAGHAQRFLSAHDGTNNLFPVCRHRLPATQYIEPPGPRLPRPGLRSPTLPEGHRPHCTPHDPQASARPMLYKLTTPPK